MLQFCKILTLKLKLNKSAKHVSTFWNSPDVCVTAERHEDICVWYLWWMCSDDLEAVISGSGRQRVCVSGWCWWQGRVHSTYQEEMTSPTHFLPRWSKTQTPPYDVKRDAIGWNGSLVTGSSNHSNRGGVCVASLALLSFLCSPFRTWCETKTYQIWDGSWQRGDSLYTCVL